MSVTVNDKNLGHATAYAYAKSKGYTGTEEEFAELMASYATVAEAAEASAQAAAQSATAASGSASAASTSAGTATTKAEEASQSATNANQSATQASGSATTAQGAAQTATEKANEANASAATALQQAQNAMTHASNAQTFADNAQTSATQAAASANTANDSANLAVEAAEEATTTVANKADKDGSYPDMSVGNVFSDDSYTEDKTPYLYRVSGGGVEVGKVEADKIVGGSIEWNQLVSIPSASKTQTLNNVTITDNRDGTYSVSTTSEGASSLTQVVVTTISSGVKGHTMLIGGNPSNSSGTTAFIVDTWSGQRYIKDSIHKITSSGIAVTIEVQSGAVITTPMVFKPQMHDLTSLFGTTIADYLYSLEQATEGSGVNLFHKLFPNAYYPYNAGELLSVSGLQSHDMVGFNQWDEEWEVGGISNLGANYPNTDRIRSKNYIPVIAGATYYFWVGTPTYGIWLWGYDADKNYVGRLPTSGYAIRNQTVTMPDNVRYIRFVMQQGYGLTYNHDICINLSWSGAHNGEYEPYVKHSYPLDSSLTLRGIPKLDSANNLYYDGDVYSADGTVTRKYGIVDMGTLTWTYQSGGFFQTQIAGVKGSDQYTVPFNGICSKYQTGSTSAIRDGNATGIAINTTPAVFVRDSSYTDAATFKAAMSGVMLVYELATPTEETAQPYTEYQKVSKYGTEEYVSTGIVPVGHITKYPTDIVSKVDGLPSDFSTLIAPTESAFKATRAYTVNELLIINNTLYKVTSAIANGATITVGTNVQQTTLSALIKALSA